MLGPSLRIKKNESTSLGGGLAACFGRAKAMFI